MSKTKLSIQRRIRLDIKPYMTCDKRPISCPFNAIGCEVMNDEMEAHLNEDNYCHSKLLIDLINKLLSEMESMKNEIIYLKSENIKFQQQSINQQQKMYEMETKMMANNGEIKEQNMKMVALSNDNTKLRSEMDTNVESIHEMRQEIERIQIKFQQKIDELKQSYQWTEVEDKEDELIIDKFYQQNLNFI